MHATYYGRLFYSGRNRRGSEIGRCSILQMNDSEFWCKRELTNLYKLRFISNWSRLHTFSRTINTISFAFLPHLLGTIYASQIIV